MILDSPTAIVIQGSADTDGAITFSNLAVSRNLGFVLGSENYLCFYEVNAGVFSPVVQFTVLPPPPPPPLPPAEFDSSLESLELRKGASETFTIKLNSAPSKATTWIVRTHPDVARLSPGSSPPLPFGVSNDFLPPVGGDEIEVTFTPSNWNRPQTLTVTGISEGTTKVSAVYVYGDWRYRNAELNIPIEVTGPPPNDFRLTRTSLEMRSGASRSFAVALENKPAAGQRGVWLLSSDLDVAIEPSQIYFDRNNWSRPQHIIVTGHSAGTGRLTARWPNDLPARPEDDLKDLEFDVRLSVSAGKSIETSLWNGADRDGFIRLSEDGYEGSSSGGFSVSLGERPTGDVTVSISSGGGVSVYPNTSLTFTPANWSTRQNISLHGAEDTDREDERGAVSLIARGGGYANISKSVGYCVDDASDDDDTCELEFSAKRPPDPSPSDPVIGPVADDETSPRLSSWRRHNPNRQNTDADVLTWRFTFNEPVTGVTRGSFKVRIDGSLSHSASHSVSGGGTTWDVTVSGGGIADLNGQVELTFRTRRGIADLAGNAFRNAMPLNGTKEKTYIVSNSNGANRFARGNQALSRISRALGLSVIGAVSERGAKSGGSRLSLAGRNVPLGESSLSSQDSGISLWESNFLKRHPAEPGSGMSRNTEPLHGSSFELSSEDGAMRLWGRADAPAGGGVETSFFGFEQSIGSDLLTGTALSHSASEGVFGLDRSESLTSSLSSAYQYLRYSPQSQTEVWSLAGMGRGTVSFEDDSGSVSAPLSMQMVAFGSRHSFGRISLGGLTPEVSADGFLVRLATEESEELRGITGEARRVRAGVMLQRPIEGNGWTPRLGLGVFHEDDYRGVNTRTEMRVGFGWVHERLSLDGAAHRWLTREAADEFSIAEDESGNSWGAQLSARYAAAPNGLGFGAALNVRQGLVPDAPVWESESADQEDTGRRLGLRASYGIAMGDARLTPWGEIRYSAGERSLREGVRYEMDDLSFGIYGEHRRLDSGSDDNAIRLDLSLRF